MLEMTQETLDKIGPLLGVGDTDSMGKLLVRLDRTSLRALLIHVLRERGVAVANAVAAAYLSETTGNDTQRRKAGCRPEA